MARQAYTRYHEEWDLPGHSAWARWEGQDRNRRSIELDIVASLDDGRTLLGEIKWSSRPVGPELHAQLVTDMQPVAVYQARCEARPAFQCALAAQFADFAKHAPAAA